MKKLRSTKKQPLGYQTLERRQLLAALTVTTFEDVIDADDEFLSLREAIDIANTNGEDDVITLASGSYIGVIMSTNTEDANVHFNIHNSILWNNFSPIVNGGDLFSGMHTYTVTNSIFYDDDPNDDSVRFDPAMGNLDDNPRFVDYATGNYLLNPGSPAIDAGDSSNLPVDTFDADGDGDTAEFEPDSFGFDRIVGDETDIGAHEFFVME